MSEPATVKRTRAMDPDLPIPSVQLANHRHTYRPTNLNGLDISPDHPSVFARQVSQPFANGLIPRVGAEETYVQYWGNINHERSVPK